MKDAVHRDRELREHDRWFRGEITEALSEADDPATARLAHESVRSSWQQQRAALEGRATGRVTGTRGLVVVGTPYIVVYRIERTVVLVLRILHGAQRWPPA